MYSRNMFPSSTNYSRKELTRLAASNPSLKSISLEFGKITEKNQSKQIYRLLDERIQRPVDDCGNFGVSRYLKGEAASMSLSITISSCLGFALLTFSYFFNTILACISKRSSRYLMSYLLTILDACNQFTRRLTVKVACRV
jgi:hypothetical protein